MATALDLITGAARLAGIVFKSEALDSDEAQDGLVSLNDMLSSWENNGLLVPSRIWESFTLANATSYSIGPGQTISTVRPTVIRSAFTRNAGIDYSMDIISDEQYESIPDKTLATGYPQYLSYDNGYPNGVIRLYPQLISGAELHLLSEKPLANIATLNTLVELPPGWNRAIRYNLAIEISGEYGVEVPAAVVKIANDSLTSIQTAIAKNRPIKYLPSSANVFNRNFFYDGYYW